MTLEALQKKTIKKRALVVDREALERINQIVDETTKVDVLSESQQKKLKEADEELKNGNYIGGDEMDKRVAKWLNEK
jgi:ribosomal protein L18